MEIQINEKLLDEKLAELEKARGWSPRIISKLESFIRTADDFSLFRINPIRFGKEKGIAEQESIELFLYGVKFGLFQMNWQLLCLGCGAIVESFDTLRMVGTHYHCNMCKVDLEASLDEYIEITFTVFPAIREIIFHRPETLSIEDFYKKYAFNPFAYYEKGAIWTDVILSQAKILSYLEPGEKKDFKVELPEGFFSGLDRLNKAEFFFTIKDGPRVENQLVPIHLSTTGKYEPSQGELTAGSYVFHFENDGNRRGALMLILTPPEHLSEPLQFPPFLSGKKLLSTQAFRDLFRSETIGGDEGIGVKDLSFLFTDLKSSTALYDRIGDLKAFALVRQHFDSLGKVINKHSGAIVKTIGDAVMATFLNPPDAVQAAIEMLEEIDRFNKSIGGKDIILKIGIHKGSSIAVTLNDRVDYFGQTVNIAARVQGLADSEEIYLTEEMFTYSGIKKILKNHKVRSTRAKLKGIQEKVKVYKVTKLMNQVGIG